MRQELRKMRKLAKNHLFESIRHLVVESKSRLIRKVNSELIGMNWEIGRLIVEDEQNGANRAQYGQEVLKLVSEQLTLEFGKGFDESNLRNMRSFYSSFPIRDAWRHELSWTHYRILARVEKQEDREQYMHLAAEEGWNTRDLERNIRSAYLGRMLEVPKAEEEKRSKTFIKDPYIFEFLGLKRDEKYQEKTIESALIDHLRQFLMELGKGFAFVERQQHIVTDTSDFFIDLVFYHYHLKCFILIDLKVDKLKHSHIGQMDMYFRMYDDLKRGEGDNPTIGIILCTEKDETIVKYSVMAENEKLFASKYRLYLPEEEELAELIDLDRKKLEEE
jgi:predicted nuclease of restriction endonuclease-like (RecB) superfamily